MPRARAAAGLIWPRATSARAICSEPASARSAPVMILMSVDFPAPFSPASACTSPAARSNDTPLSACTPAKDLWTPPTESTFTPESPVAGRAEVRSGVIAARPGALSGNPLHVAALPQGIERVGGQASCGAPLADQRADVGGKGILQARLRLHEPAARLRCRQPAEIDECRFRVQRLRGDHGLHHRFDLPFEIVALVDHVKIGRA